MRVKHTHLRLEPLPPVEATAPRLTIRRCVDANLAHALYLEVGRPWLWRNRRAWTPDDWRALLEREGVELWVAVTAGGEDCGYFELHSSGDAKEVVYFGLRPEHIGQGLGKKMLRACVERCREKGARGVKLMTRATAHPSALPMYLSFGFRVEREEFLDIPND